MTADQARAALEPVVATFPSAEIQDLDEFKQAVKAQYDIILVPVNVLLALTILIAMIGIVNTLVLSVVERTREIAPTRAVGAGRGQIRATIRWEALLIAGFGLGAALATGVFFGWVPVRALAADGFSVFAVPAGQLLVFAAVTGMLTLAAAVFPAAWAARRRILPAIVDHRPPAERSHTGGMALDPAALPDAAVAFVTERHLATLTTLRPDGTPHVVPVGFTWDPAAGLARVITFAPSRKVRNLRAHGDGVVPRAVVCQVDGGRWLAFEGPATVTDDPDRVAEAVRRYAERYRHPGERADRVAIEIAVDRVLGRA